MGLSKLHLIGMWFSEGLAITSLILYIFFRDTFLALTFIALVIIASTLHITYLLSEIYLKIKICVCREYESGRVSE